MNRSRPWLPVLTKGVARFLILGLAVLSLGASFAQVSFVPRCFLAKDSLKAMQHPFSHKPFAHRLGKKRVSLLEDSLVMAYRRQRAFAISS